MMKSIHPKVHLLLGLTLLACACHGPRGPEALEAAPSTAAAESARPVKVEPGIGALGLVSNATEYAGPPLTESYPKGRWRLAPAGQLARTVLWCSHILIRHRDVPPQLVSFAAPFWFSAPPAPERSRVEALQLAESIRAKLGADGGSFTTLARQHSEDVATRATGGALGGLRAFDLGRWPAVLDALAMLKAGQVSRVVETEYGFHLLLRHAPPALDTVSGERLVIAHDQAPWLKAFLARGTVPTRTRQEASELAQSIYEQARHHPDTFARWIDVRSEHVDALRGGDLGQWSTREATLWPREVEVLRQLQVGEIAPPVESLLGFEILRRVPNRPRAQLAARAIRFSFDVSRSSGEGAPVAAFQQAEELLTVVREEPSRFDELRERHDGLQPWTWVEGVEAAPIEVALRTLTPGQIATKPVRVDSLSSYLVLQRLAPSEVSTPAALPVLFELPSPAEPDVPYLISDVLDATSVREIFSEALQATAGGSRHHQLRAVNDLIGGFNGQLQAEATIALFEEFKNRARAILGEPLFADYERELLRRIEETSLARE